MPVLNAASSNQRRHLAFQIIAQLSDDTGEALAVLDYARMVLLRESAEPPAPVELKVVDK